MRCQHRSQSAAFARCGLGPFLVLIVAVVLGGGCFSERSFRLDPTDVVQLQPQAVESTTTRDWLVSTHGQLAHLLPRWRTEPALITHELSTAPGIARDVFQHFGRRRESLVRLFGNWHGLQQTAQCVGAITTPGHPPPPWDGFEQVWIPVAEGIELSGRLGWSLDQRGELRTAQCIVLLPGLLGDNAILRTRDLARLLREYGFHVLALELRGHGQTEIRYPDIPYNFGVLEVGDLLVVSDWLQDHAHVTRTGMIGFCWGANLGILSAWYDGCDGEHESISEEFEPYLFKPCGRTHYSAGIIAIAPVLRFENLMDELERSWSIFVNPVYSYLQQAIEGRMRLKGYRPATGSLWRLIRLEFHRMGMTSEKLIHGAQRFLRLLPYQGQSAGDKLEDARIPVLILHAVNDPLAPAQDVADLIATLDNPQVAAVILAGGGHGGFPVYARNYYLSLLVGFFDPLTGAAATCGHSPARTRDSIAPTAGRS